MIDKNSKNISYPAQLAIFLGITGAGWIIGSLICVAIWMMMTGRSIFTMEQDMFNAKYYSAAMVLQAVSTFFAFLVPVYFYALICYRKPFKYLGYNSHFNFRQFFLMVCILILVFPLGSTLAELNKLLPIPEYWASKFKAMETAREAQEAALIQINTFPKYILSLLMIAFLPALFEETFFRAGVQQLFIRWFKGPWVATILTSIIFSLIHLSYYGFLVRAVLGVILGLLFYYSGSLWLNILFHFLFNGLQVTALYFYSMGKPQVAKNMDTNFPIGWGLIAGVLIIYLFMIYKRTSAIQLSKYTEGDIASDDPIEWTKVQS